MRARGRSQPREQAEGPVHVQPSAVPLGELGHVRDRVEVTAVHVAGVADEDGGGLGGGQLAAQRVHVQTADTVFRQPPDKPG